MVKRKEDYTDEFIDIRYLNYRWEAEHFGEHHFVPKLYLWQEKPGAEIVELRDSIEAEGLHNPFIVKQANYTKKFDKKSYYVIIGNRRLCAMRGMKFEGKIHCIVVTDADSWQDNTTARKIFGI